MKRIKAKNANKVPMTELQWVKKNLKRIPKPSRWTKRYWTYPQEKLRAGQKCLLVVMITPFGQHLKQLLGQVDLDSCNEIDDYLSSHGMYGNECEYYEMNQKQSNEMKRCIDHSAQQAQEAVTPLKAANKIVRLTKPSIKTHKPSFRIIRVWNHKMLKHSAK